MNINLWKMLEVYSTAHHTNSCWDVGMVIPVDFDTGEKNLYSNIKWWRQLTGPDLCSARRYMVMIPIAVWKPPLNTEAVGQLFYSLNWTEIHRISRYLWEGKDIQYTVF